MQDNKKLPQAQGPQKGRSTCSLEKPGGKNSQGKGESKNQEGRPPRQPESSLTRGVEPPRTAENTIAGAQRNHEKSREERTGTEVPGSVEEPDLRQVSDQTRVNEEVRVELNPKGKVAHTASFQQYAEMVQERKQRIRGLTARPKKLEPSGIKQWECEGGELRYRQHVIGRGASIETHMEEEFPHPQKASAEQCGENQDLLETLPISQVRLMQERGTATPIEITFKDRINDLTGAEKAMMKNMGLGHRPSHRADYVHPEAIHIARCPFPKCNAPINTRGIERAIKTHLSVAHKDILCPVLATVLNYNQTKLAKYWIPPRGEAEEEEG